MYLAVFLLFLGSILLIIGLSLYLRGDPEDSGEDAIIFQGLLEFSCRRGTIVLCIGRLLLPTLMHN